MKTGADRASSSVERLARRAATVPVELSAAPLPPLPDFAGHERWIVSGLGASEGPARLLVAQLVDQGLSARYLPATSFVATAPEADVLVLVSQRLSPNARIPLRHRASFRAVVLVTSLDPSRDPTCARLAAEGVVVLQHGPAEEDGSLLRIVGPALATRMVLHLSSAVAGQRGRAPAWLARAPELAAATARAAAKAPLVEAEWLFGPTAIVTSGADESLAIGLRTKLLEALGVAEPAIWDLLGIVHGPLPSFYDARLLLFVLEPATGPATALCERLERVLVPARHRLQPLRATLPSPLSYFEYAAALDAIVIHALRARPRDLSDWPSKGKDGPLYDVDEATDLDQSKAS